MTKIEIDIKQTPGILESILAFFEHVLNDWKLSATLTIHKDQWKVYHQDAPRYYVFDLEKKTFSWIGDINVNMCAIDFDPVTTYQQVEDLMGFIHSNQEALTEEPPVKEEGMEHPLPFDMQKLLESWNKQINEDYYKKLTLVGGEGIMFKPTYHAKFIHDGDHKVPMKKKPYPMFVDYAETMVKHKNNNDAFDSAELAIHAMMVEKLKKLAKEIDAPILVSHQQWKDAHET